MQNKFYVVRPTVKKKQKLTEKAKISTPEHLNRIFERLYHLLCRQPTRRANGVGDKV